MKHCPRCGLTKARGEFHLNRIRSDGHQSICKACRAEIDRARYLLRKESGASRDRRFERERMAWLRSLKAGKPCTDCGQVFPPEAMQWDHLPGVSKRGDITTLRGLSKAEVLDEVAKCELVCANCHTTRTFRRAGWRLEEEPARYLVAS